MIRIALSSLFVFTFLIACSQKNITKLGQLTYSDKLNDIWGWTSSTGEEYALVGTKEGVSIVDITDPKKPIEVFFKQGASSIWRDLKTWDDHLYVTNETADGLMIIDLSTLPTNNNLTVSHFSGINFPFQKAHNLYIDENGICYVFGANKWGGGAIILDLNTDPKLPKELGVFSDYYLHDGFVRGDTLWGAAINDGLIFCINVTDKTSPEIVSSWQTPFHFSHNCWLSDDGNFLFTTDEKSGAYIAGFDISDLQNVIETDGINSSPGMGVIPHNTHFINKYLVTSYYTDGVVITDVCRPHNMITVGSYDTSPLFSGSGYEGAWGAYPWLPSGNLIVSDGQEGLYILKPDYKRGCYLEGVIKDEVCGVPLSNVYVEIINENVSDASRFDGTFATGTPNKGVYSVLFSKNGYVSKVVNNVKLSNDSVTILEVKMTSNKTVNLEGTIKNQALELLQNVQIKLDNGSEVYTFISDSQGKFNKCNVLSDIYTVTVGKWGYQTRCMNNVMIDNSNSTLNIELLKGYADDFTFDFGWTITSTTSNGKWERLKPIGTFHNGKEESPSGDIDLDCSDRAYITGNYSDVDKGLTRLSSPKMNLLGMDSLYLNYYKWFYNNTLNPEDTVQDENYISVKLSNGLDTVELSRELISTNPSKWRIESYKISDYITLTDSMQFLVEVADLGFDGIVEAGIDGFSISNTPLALNESIVADIQFELFPNPYSNSLNISYDVSGFDSVEILVLNIMGQVVDRVQLGASIATITYDTKLNSGLYFIQLRNNTAVLKTLKVIKSK